MLKQIQSLILSIAKPFNKADIVILCKKQLNIGSTLKEQKMIFQVLDDLCENGRLIYADIGNDTWAFIVRK